jgi:DNA-binding NtrC family response regulator
VGSQQPRARVLLLEDDPELRSLLVEFLLEEGFEVAICDSYASIQEALRGPGKSIVVADFWGASHAELSRRERDQIRELGRRAPTILLTGRTWAAATDAEELQVVCVIPKPPNLDELIAQVHRCVSLSSEAG